MRFAEYLDSLGGDWCLRVVIALLVGLPRCRAVLGPFFLSRSSQEESSASFDFLWKPKFAPYH